MCVSPLILLAQIDFIPISDNDNDKNFLSLSRVIRRWQILICPLSRVQCNCCQQYDNIANTLMCVVDGVNFAIHRPQATQKTCGDSHPQCSQLTDWQRPQQLQHWLLQEQRREIECNLLQGATQEILYHSLWS